MWVGKKKVLPLLSFSLLMFYVWKCHCNEGLLHAHTVCDPAVTGAVFFGLFAHLTVLILHQQCICPILGSQKKMMAYCTYMSMRGLLCMSKILWVCHKWYTGCLCTSHWSVGSWALTWNSFGSAPLCVWKEQGFPSNASRLSQSSISRHFTLETDWSSNLKCFCSSPWMGRHTRLTDLYTRQTDTRLIFPCDGSHKTFFFFCEFFGA